MNLPVTILTNERDFAADGVIRHLNDLRADVRRVNVEKARSSPVRRWVPTQDASDVSVVWWRQFEADVQPGDLEGAEDVLVERAQWRTWISTLNRPGSRWLNDLWAARRAENKVEQLRSANHLGFRLPETLVTNDRVEAQRFSDEHGETVVKTLSSAYFPFTDHSFVFTESFSHTGLDDPQRWHASPLIVQRRLTNALDARVISFGARTFGACCRAAGLDWRKTPYQPDLWREWDVPGELAQLCARYRAEFGLEYAAFDFMIDDVGAWFLEANQAGEFAFIDRALELGIARGIAELLVTMASCRD